MMMEIRGGDRVAERSIQGAGRDRTGAAGAFREQLSALLDQRPAAPRPAEGAAVKLAAADMAVLKTELIRHGAKPKARAAVEPAGAAAGAGYPVE